MKKGHKQYYKEKSYVQCLYVWLNCTKCKRKSVSSKQKKKKSKKVAMMSSA